MAKKVLSKEQLKVMELGQALFKVEGAIGSLNTMRSKYIPIGAVQSVFEAVTYLEEARDELRAWNIKRHKKLVSP